MGGECVLQVRGLSKSFPGVRALDRVDLDLRPGSVHAVVGENGAGKSTLMRILIGLETPDGGGIWFQRHRIEIRSPHQALRLGLAMIHQELMPFPQLTVAENIFMGHEPASRILGWIDRAALNREAQRLLERLGFGRPPTVRMGDLGVAEMQLVEIARALAHKARVVIMDEPTSALSDRESQALFAAIRDLQQDGVAILYVSHKLDEVFRSADTVTVLRDGRQVATGPLGGFDEERLIAHMVGRPVTPTAPDTGAAGAEVALAVRGLSRAGRFRNVQFAVRQGEILGLAGLMGAGRTEVLGALFGLQPADAGEVRVEGRSVRLRHPQDAIRQGIALVSEDRKRYGLVLRMSVKENLTLSSLRRCCRAGFIEGQAERRVADDQIRAFAIRAGHRDQRASELSGGSQQKVVMGKALLTEPKILLLDEPTRGIDIGAKAEVHAIIRRFAREGRAIVVASSELPELFALCDRILVMRQGEIAAELESRRATAAEVLRHAMPR